MANIGFIGLGHMGQPMVHNLLREHNVTVYDINQEAVKALADHGANVANHLQQLAEQSEVIFTMVQTGEQVQKICTDADGLFAHAAAGTLFIDCSSIDIETSRGLHDLAEQRGFAMLDAPVSGGVAGATAGTLTIMVGGKADSFTRAEPILHLVGKNIIHAGAAGNGQAAKICNNMLLGISMIGVSEAFTLAEKLGLSAEKLFAISSKSSGQCWAMTSYSPVPGLVENVPSNNDYKAGFTSAMMLKDLRLSQQAASMAGMTTPLGQAATNLYETFADEHGQLDFSAIIKLIAR